MGTTFSNTDAAICGIVAICELIFVIAYISVTSVQLRKKLISMGRVIPTMQMIFVGGSVPPSHVIQAYPANPYQNMPPGSHAPPPPPSYQSQDYHSSSQPPPAPGFYQPGDYQAPPAPGFSQAQDYPPPYSAHNAKS